MVEKEGEELLFVYRKGNATAFIHASRGSRVLSLKQRNLETFRSCLLGKAKLGNHFLRYGVGTGNLTHI